MAISNGGGLTLDDAVTSLNGLNGAVTLSAGTNITLTPSGNDIEISASGSGAVDSVNGQTGVVVLDTGDIAEAADANYVSDAQLVVIGNTSGTNTGDQTSIAGITGTKAEFDTACTDGNFLYAGDITQYTDEMAQDAVGGILTDSAEIALAYNDATPSITASIVTGSIDETKLDASVNASLDLADSALQSGDNISELTNDAGYYNTAEQIQDIAGPLVATGGTKTRIAVTYQDATNDMDFVVDNDLGNYDSTNLSLTASQISDFDTEVSNNADVAANTAARHAAVTLGTANGLSLATQQLSLGLSSTSTTGALSDTDWDTFNNKQDAIPATDIEYFSSSGTWNKPAGAKAVYVILVGGGGGGGSGRKGAAGSNRAGGRGGQAGIATTCLYPANELSSSETVTIGAGGAGAAGQTTNSNNGISGSDGGASYFGGTTAANSKQTATGGTGGAGGTALGTNAQNAVYGITFQYYPGNQSGSSLTTGADGLRSAYGPGGGGGGAGLNSSNTESDGGPGGDATQAFFSSGNGGGAAGGAAGGGAGNAGANGTTDGTSPFIFGSGGSGSGSDTAVTAGDGGVGGSPGGGGGGGAAGVDSVSDSADGGDGAAGGCMVITYF